MDRDLGKSPRHHFRQPGRRRFWVVVALAVLAPPYALTEASERDDRTSAAAIVALLNKDCWGCGPDAYSDKDLPHPMAFALLTSTGVSLRDRNLTAETANWLVDNSTLNSKVGWGLGFAWDAFSDGSENPPDTIYGITTALAVAGLIDAYEFLGDNRYLETANAALDGYATAFTETTDGGYFWYSNQRSDDISVFNVTSMLMAQYARLGALTNNDRFVGLANDAASHLLAHVEMIDALPYWPYSDRNAQPNDSVHAAYVVQGLVEHAHYAGKTFNVDDHARYLATFSTSEGVKEFSPLHVSALPAHRAHRPARLWGIGMLIYTLADVGKADDARVFVKDLARYEANGGFSNIPGGETINEPRMIAHLTKGLARLEAVTQDW